MQVQEIWRFPVKSLGGERLDAVPVDERGIEFDRAWGLLDPATGMILTARREPALLFLAAAVDDEGRPVVTTTDGVELPDDAALSAHLGRPVELRSALDGPGTFENPMNVDDETEWMQWQSAGLTFHDGRSTISLVSRATLRDWDVRRFRINVVLDGEGDDAFSGELDLGSTTLSIRRPIDRCVMVARPQPGIDRDLEVLKTIIRERENRLGVGATVRRAGTIAIGDHVVPAS